MKSPFLFVLLICLFANNVFAQDDWSGLWRGSSDIHEFAKDMTWYDFEKRHQRLTRDGFSLIDIETHLEEGGRQYHAVWKKNYSDGQEIILEKDLTDLNNALGYLGAGYSMSDIESYVENGTRYYLSVCTKDNRSTKVKTLRSWETLSASLAGWANQGWQVFDIELHSNDGGLEFLVLLEKFSGTANQIYYYHDYRDLKAERSTLTENGWRPLDFERSNILGKKHYLCVYEATKGRWSMWHRNTEEAFVDLYYDKGSSNLQFIDIEAHQADYQVATFTPSFDGKIALTPDLSQGDKGFPANVSKGDYCGPVAVSNGLVWLSQNGYPHLNPYSKSKEGQIEMAVDLATLMDTESNNGTGVTAMIDGLKKYVSESGYRYESIQYKGWRCAGRNNAADKIGNQPDWYWMQQAIEGKSVVFLNVGWYDYNRSTNTYTRNGGHWVTAVGHGVDAEDGSKYIIIHDPSGRTGYNKSQQYLQLEKIRSGGMNSNNCGAPDNLAGYYKCGGSLLLKTSAGNSAILDAVVVLQMD